MIRRGALLLALVAALAAGTAQARPAPYPGTRAALDALVRAGAPGAIVLIRNGGSTTVLAAGVADRKTHAPMRPDDRFRIASITKSFVATIVLQLVGEKKLSLSDPVSRFLPMGGPAAHGYYQGQDVTPLSFSFAWAAGSMVSTAGDVARFYQALLGGKLLGPQQLKQMETTVPADADEYGLGLWRRGYTCGYGWGHPGLAVGYTSFAWSSRDGHKQVVALATTTNVPSPPAADFALRTLVDKAFCGS